MLFFKLFSVFTLVVALTASNVNCTISSVASAIASTSGQQLSPSTEEQPIIFNGEGCEQDQVFQTKFKPQIEKLASDAQRIIRHVIQEKGSGRTYEDLAKFVDKFGSRLTGTENLEHSIDYMIDLLKKEGHDNVHGESVVVPKWTRGKEWAEMIKPRNKKLNILGLGYSVGTEGKTIEAPVVVVRSFDELEKRSNEINGKIVVYDFQYESYGKQGAYRYNGASRAAKHGAVAAMIRSLTPFSIDSPHTGMQVYEANVTRIPAISITAEDADLFRRFVERKEEVVVRIYSENQNHPENGISRNTISDITGSQYPEEVVVVSGHIDSWDVGQGAMDDAGGAFISWRALSILKELGLRPKRTIRSILWTAEEFGLIGAQDYVKKHKSELKNYVLAMESDFGTFTPRGLTFSGKNRTDQCTMWKIMQFMAPINATQLTIMPEGSDIQVFYEQNVPISSLDTYNERYFYYHHTQGDTMSVEQSDALDKCQALWTTVAYVLASIDDRLSIQH